MKKDSSIPITSLDYSILGLVSQQPLSGYGIRKIFETTALGNYSNSPGTIYPALKRLQKFGLIKKQADKNDGKNKFHITIKGLNSLKEWLVKPLEENDIIRKKDEIFLRFAFMDDLISTHQKLIFLLSFQTLLKNYIKQLQTYHKEESHNLKLHGRLAFEYGIESYKTALSWCIKTMITLKKIQNNEQEINN